jgi:hypothetical protein
LFFVAHTQLLLFVAVVLFAVCRRFIMFAISPPHAHAFPLTRAHSVDYCVFRAPSSAAYNDAAAATAGDPALAAAAAQAASCPSFFYGGSAGVVFFADDLGHCSEGEYRLALTLFRVTCVLCRSVADDGHTDVYALNRYLCFLVTLAYVAHINLTIDPLQYITCNNEQQL